MEAVVNLKMSPDELRLVRSALQALKAEEYSILRESSDADEKKDARRTILRVDSLLEKV